jgi:predicted nucleic acid-binding protein
MSLQSGAGKFSTWWRSVNDFPRLQALAGRHQLTAYDVAYLDLAKRLSLPLATLDGDLGKAAIAERIELPGQ